jgi:hypothetical protein
LKFSAKVSPFFSWNFFGKDFGKYDEDYDEVSFRRIEGFNFNKINFGSRWKAVDKSVEKKLKKSLGKVAHMKSYL